MKLEPDEHWNDEDPKQMDMWPEDIERERRFLTWIVVTIIAIGIVAFGYFMT